MSRPLLQPPPCSEASALSTIRVSTAVWPDFSLVDQPLQNRVLLGSSLTSCFFTVISLAAMAQSRSG